MAIQRKYFQNARLKFSYFIFSSARKYKSPKGTLRTFADKIIQIIKLLFNCSNFSYKIARTRQLDTL